MREREVLELLRPLAGAGARGFLDDAAVVLPPLGRELVVTHDVLAAGVHFLPGDPPGDVAFKLLAVNLSDLATMGAQPLGVMLGLGFSAAEDRAWLEGFARGLGEGCERWGTPLLGGDTVSGLDRAVLGLTALGTVERGAALSRSGARAGDLLWVTGNIGDAGLGLAVARGEAEWDDSLAAAYRRPEPRLSTGRALIGVASAAIDVSDGLLLDASRLAQASGVEVSVDLVRLPISRAAEARGAERLWLASAGDDYELLFTAPVGAPVEAIGRQLKTRVTRIGEVREGRGLVVMGEDGERVEPERLGWEHG